MLAAGFPAAAGQRQVDRLSGPAVGGSEPGGRRVDQLLDLVAARIESAAGILALLRRDTAHLLGEGREQAVAPEVIDSDLLDGRGVGSRGGLRPGFGQRLIDFLNNRIHKNSSTLV